MTGAPKDRWHELADAVQDSNLPASDKAVFRYLLDRSEYGTADLAARFTPLRTTIAARQACPTARSATPHITSDATAG